MTELERQKRVTGMLITGHSVLRDKYFTLSSIFDIGLLISAIILNTLVFVDAKLVTDITTITEPNQRIITGAVSVITFGISIVLLQVRWREKAADHARAADQLFFLLQECRGILDLEDDEEKRAKAKEFNKKYSQISGMLAKIPENKFNSLKLIHYRKIELSKLIDKHPGSRIFILKIKLFISSFKKV